MTSRQQVVRLRRTALEILRQYPVDVARLRLLNHGFNTTFRVDSADGRRFALRLNVNSHRTTQNIAAELAWLTALAVDTDLWLPVPQPRRDGALMAEVFSPDLDRSLPAVLFSWLPGRDVGDDASVAQLRAAGRATATLHGHGENWSLPTGAALPLIDSVLMDTPNHLAGEHPLLTEDRRTVIEAAFAHVQRHNDELFAGAHRHALHADLHTSNMKWHRGRLSVFDFDDSGIGVPVQDLAIAAYYLRDNAEQEAALLEGYQELRTLPAYTSAQFEAIVASRNLILLNDVIVSSNAGFRAIAPRYVANTVVKLRHYLDTGIYRHDVPGVIAVS